MPNTKQEERYLREWAARHEVVYDPEGECGLGRECVGIRDGDIWIDLGPPKTEEFDGRYYTFPDTLEAAVPPEEVTDAYHKHDCLAVLGRGPDAIHQLYLWVRHLEANGLIPKRTPRQPTSVIDLALHGTYTSHLAEA